MGYPTALSAPNWGFYDTFFDGQAFQLPRPFSSYVMQHVLFKVAFPAEFHAQTAVEAAIQLHPLVQNRIGDVQKITIESHESALRIIDKTGQLTNPADRDHCLQYMIAVALLKGTLTAADYEDEAASDPQIDRLRQKMVVSENISFSQDYLDPDKRSIANSLQIHFEDGSSTEKVTVEYPLGHRRRRVEARPLLIEKFKRNVSNHYSPQHTDQLVSLFETPNNLDTMPVADFVESWLTPSHHRRI